MNYDGGEPRMLPGNGSQPTWSPDGTTLIYARTADLEGDLAPQLYSVKADGSEIGAPTPVANETAISESPAYSPDGGQIAYAGKESSAEAWGLYTADRDGTEVSHLNLGGVGDVDDPQFTPDNEHIIFLATSPPSGRHSYPTNKASIRNLYEVNVDGSDLWSSPGFVDTLIVASSDVAGRMFVYDTKSWRAEGVPA
jgi:Tol biopolymer transport system component